MFGLMIEFLQMLISGRSPDAVRTAPAGREMDMHEIEGFGILVIRQVRPLVIYLDNVYLSK